jgi:hypothetical protein
VSVVCTRTSSATRRTTTAATASCQPNPSSPKPARGAGAALGTRLSSAIRSLTPTEPAVNFDAFLVGIAAPNLGHLALLNAVLYAFQCAPASLARLTKLHRFQL